jgi:hypothetical protein
VKQSFASFSVATAFFVLINLHGISISRRVTMGNEKHGPEITTRESDEEFLQCGIRAPVH